MKNVLQIKYVKDDYISSLYGRTNSRKFSLPLITKP